VSEASQFSPKQTELGSVLKRIMPRNAARGVRNRRLILPSLAPNGSQEMSAMSPLSGDKRTYVRHRLKIAFDPNRLSDHGSTARPDPTRAHFQCASLIKTMTQPRGERR